jgi:pantothenate kinase
MIELSMAAAVERAAGLVKRGRAVLGITGCPGAGKSTLSAMIAAAVPSSVVLPMDGFHLPNDELVRLGRRDRKGAPDTFDAAGYVALLDHIRNQGRDTVPAPRYDRAASRSVANAINVDPGVDLVVTEGNYLLLGAEPWCAVRDLLDEVWYVDLDDGVRVPRLIARHIEFGKTPDEARDWVLRSDEANAVLIAASRNRADAVVRGR